jgi:hypothetical protein
VDRDGAADAACAANDEHLWARRCGRLFQKSMRRVLASEAPCATVARFSACDASLTVHPCACEGLQFDFKLGAP